MRTASRFGAANARPCPVGEQADALAHVTDGRDLWIVVGHAGTGRRDAGRGAGAWEAAGYEVRGVALSGIAAENLESGSGIASAPSPAWSMAGNRAATV
jgi:hypothetical protein